MQNFQEPPFDLKEQVESAYGKRGGVISLAIKTRRRTTDFSYRGHISPFSNRADRFHVGRFASDLTLPPNIRIGTSVMRECCQNVLFTPLRLPNEELREGLAALKGTKITKAAVQEFIAPHLPSPHHRLALQDLDSDLFEVVDVLTAIGRAEPESYVALGLFCGLLVTRAARGFAKCS